MSSPSKRGPRGGKTTISKNGNLVRKTFWLHPDGEEALRRAAIVRELLRRNFGIED